jgi:hypothetical protein
MSTLTLHPLIWLARRLISSSVRDGTQPFIVDRILMQREAEGYHPKFELQIRIRRPKQSHGLQKLFDLSADSRRQSWFDPGKFVDDRCDHDS